MRRLAPVFLALLAAGCQSPTAPRTAARDPVAATPVLEFVSACPAVTVFLLQRDTARLGLWAFFPGGALDDTVSVGLHTASYTQLDANGFPVAAHDSVLDVRGLTRYRMACRR